VGLQEVARDVRVVDLEALGWAAVPRRQPHVMEHGAGIEQFAVERQPASQASQRAKAIDPTSSVIRRHSLLSGMSMLRIAPAE
jgi:hypothetical protein